MGLVIWVLVIVVILTILWSISSVARWFIKWTVFILGAGCSASLPIPLMLLKPRDSKNALMPAAGLRLVCSLIGIKVTVEGEENIVKDSGCVVLINHQSQLDLLVLANLWPKMDNGTVIAKSEILYLQPFALAAWLWGTIFIDRVKSQNAQEAVNKTGEIIRKRKARVFIFPEGTRSQGKMLPFKKGGFHLALASRVPIQPVAVSKYTFLNNYSFNSGHMKIKILPPISTEGRTKEDIPELIDESYKVISESVDALSTDNLQVNGFSNGKKID